MTLDLFHTQHKQYDEAQNPDKTILNKKHKEKKRDASKSGHQSKMRLRESADQQDGTTPWVQNHRKNPQANDPKQKNVKQLDSTRKTKKRTPKRGI
jgi:hypothetical protein